MNIEILTNILEGDVVTDEETLKKYSHDASLFEVKPLVVVFPKNVEDVKKMVDFAKDSKGVYLTARSGGTDMTGGPLGESIILSFEKYFNKIYLLYTNGISSINFPSKYTLYVGGETKSNPSLTHLSSSNNP